MSMAWVWLALSLLGSTAGNILMKFTSRSSTNGIEMFLSIPFLIGTVLFAAGLICYVRALETLPLGVAYPVLVGCSIVAISFVAIMFFGESISFAHVAGVVLIFLGIVILARSVNLA